ncbi:alpha-amylase/4-alpha-glucanotransferase domain-containing protein [Rhodocyclus gracilis]|uniref:DUF1926 domain-containing protein n=1 Tax=Rhodocyclus tenuis TaxID=1066 RepID=A0A6L5JWI2_RHOTE|nr:alpha-amylase/4-alpha-glucanotransferase domain-containing protein [Rhodocyclus gracilis]MQY50548.1 DUF1926 domain-containing protein [Rhodocyclus gracilis]
MTQPVTLLFGVHAHQPVGNFPEVIADAHERCYRPFLHTLYAYPDFRFSVHFSGWLLDWLRQRYPEDMELLAEMVRRGQVELFGSGDTEPVLASIPARDRIGQIERLSSKLAEWTGQRPSGAWLTERVWESSVVPSLAAAGIDYVAVDDTHFLYAGQPADALDGYFSTEEGGVRLDLFAISEALRYRLPFSPAPEAVDYLASLAAAGRSAAVYFDDIEKFGVWPETHDWVYGRGWLKAFIEGVLAHPDVTTGTYADFHRQHAGRGVIYLPTASYSEMNEWTLPAAAAADYSALLAQEENAGRMARNRPFLRGGIWRNFFSRYTESNWTHKRMLGLSARLHELQTRLRADTDDHPTSASEFNKPDALSESNRLAAITELTELTDTLYRAQANDAYWHGLFGGLYLPHLRRALWNNLIALEAALDRLAPRPALGDSDVDLDGRREWLAHNAIWQLAVRDDGLAALHELSNYPLTHNFADTLRRYAEHYHSRIGDSAPPPAPGDGIASAHDIVRCKQPISSADILPDAAPRALCLDRLDGELLADYAPTAGNTQTPHAPIALRFARAGIVKSYRLIGSALEIVWHCQGLAGRSLAVELNLAMPSCDGYAGRYRLADGSVPGGFGQALHTTSASRLDLEDGVLGAALRLSLSSPATLDGQAHFTVSQSEAGFEKIMQAVELTLHWPLTSDDELLTLRLEHFALSDSSDSSATASSD